jgi:hypothetical protein
VRPELEREHGWVAEKHSHTVAATVNEMLGEPGSRGEGPVDPNATHRQGDELSQQQSNHKAPKSGILLTGMLCQCEFGTLNMRWCPTRSTDTLRMPTCWQIKHIKRWLRRNHPVAQNGTCVNFVDWLKRVDVKAMSPEQSVVVSHAIPYVLAWCNVTGHTIETFVPYIDSLELYGNIVNDDNIGNEVVSHLSSLLEATQETYDELSFGRVSDMLN